MIGIDLALSDMTRGGGLSRAEFVARVTAILGVTPVLGYLPDSTDTTTSTDPWAGGTWTADGDMTGQIFALGNGFFRAFVSASLRYLWRSDDPSFSFGNGTTDQAFCIFALANVTDSAAARTIVAKFENNTTAREWVFNVTVADALRLLLYDETADVNPFRASNAPVTQGSWALHSAGYDGSGGATAANGIALDQNGVVIASTATNAGTYVAMQDTAGRPTIGVLDLSNLNAYFDGGIAFVVAAKVNPSQAQKAAMNALCHQYFGVPA